jgi:uncharacterized protein (TIRG00374 family)
VASRTIAGRFRQGLIVGIGLATLLYGGYFAWVGADEVGEALAAFHWPIFGLLLALSLGNYFLRFLRWEYFLRRLAIEVPTGSSVSIFLAGLAMTITPGKVGEFLKSYLLKESHGIGMARSAPVVIAERIGDLLGLLLLASFGVASYGGQGAQWVLVIGGLGIAAVLAVLQSWTLTRKALDLVAKLPIGARIAPRLEEALVSSRELMGGKPLVVGLLLGTLAWYLECLGYYFAFSGFADSAIPHGLAVFGYAFSTVAGVLAPGGLGPTDLGLIELAQRFQPGIERDVASAASFLVRVATLWFAVFLGALALMRFKGAIDVDVDEARAGAKDEAVPSP